MWPHQLALFNTIYSLLIGTFGITYVIASMSGQRLRPVRFFGILIIAVWLWLPLFFLHTPLHRLYDLLRSGFRYFLFYLFYIVFVTIFLISIVELFSAKSSTYQKPAKPDYQLVTGQLFWLAIPLLIFLSARGYWRVVLAPGLALLLLTFFMVKWLEKRERKQIAAKQKKERRQAEEDFKAVVAQRCDQIIDNGEFDNFLGIFKEIEDKKGALEPQTIGKLGEFAKKHGIAPIIAALNFDKWRPYDRHLAEAIGTFSQQNGFANSTDHTVIDHLIAALKHPNSDIQITIINALGQTKDPQSLEPLIEKAGDPAKQVRLAAATALAAVGQPQWQDIIKGDQDDWHRIAISRHPYAYRPLVHALEASDASARTAAVNALGLLHDDRAVEPLIAAWQDKEVKIARDAMVNALRQHIDARIVIPLLPLLPDWDIGRDLKKMIATIADASTIDSLLTALTQENSNRTGVLHDLLEIAGMIADRRLADWLADFIRNTDAEPLRFAALESLAKQPGADIVALLIELLKSEHESDQRFAARALIEYGDNRAADPLWRLASSQGDSAAKTNAICALVKIGDLRVAEMIIDTLFEHQTHPALPYCQRLFADYTSLIVSAADGVSREESCYTGASGNEDPHYSYRYRDDWKTQAVRQLCALQTAIATNLLHKVALLRDREVVQQEGYYGTSHLQLTFDGVRGEALDELKRRGNPPYDPTIYAQRGNWAFPNDPNS